MNTECRTVTHRWDLTPREAVAVQRRLAARVEIAPPAGDLRYVAGVDAAFSRDGQQCLATAVVWDRDRKTVVEQAVAAGSIPMPYIPGLLSFREAPTILAALRKLRTTPDALLCDGQGLAHPRRFGIACHLGVLTGLPSVGCAKSRLTGEHRPPGRRRGAATRLLDRGEVVGMVVRTRDGVKPLYVSVGHRIDLYTAVRLVLRCGGGYRLPEPTRRADLLVAKAKRGEHE